MPKLYQSKNDSLHSIHNEIKNLQFNLKSGQLTSETAAKALVEMNARSIIKSSLRKHKHAIRSNQIERYIGLPVWGIATTAPAALFYMRLAYTLPYGKTFFALLKQGMNISHFDATIWGRIFKTFMMHGIARTMVSAWEMQFTAEAARSAFNYSMQNMGYEHDLKFAKEVAFDFDQLIQLIRKENGGQAELAEFGLKEIGIKPESQANKKETLNVSAHL
jgi:hypothetical protein